MIRCQRRVVQPNTRSLKPFLSQEGFVTVVHAFITSLLYGICKYSLNRLQGTQKTAARIVASASKYDHITPILQKLRWLPVYQRI